MVEIIKILTQITEWVALGLATFTVFKLDKKNDKLLLMTHLQDILIEALMQAIAEDDKDMKEVFKESFNEAKKENRNQKENKKTNNKAKKN